MSPIGVLFLVLMLLGVLCGIAMWRADDCPLPREGPRRVFRYVHREDRAAYCRIMRRTWAVQMRDAGRAMSSVARALTKALTPAIQRATEVMLEFGRAFRDRRHE